MRRKRTSRASSTALSVWFGLFVALSQPMQSQTASPRQPTPPAGRYTCSFPFAGIITSNPEHPEKGDSPSFLVLAVNSRSFGESLGLVPGDRILAIGEQKTDSCQLFGKPLGQAVDTGAEVTLMVSHVNGNTVSLSGRFKSISQSPPVAQVSRLHGYWRFPIAENNGVTFSLRLFFYLNRETNREEAEQLGHCSDGSEASDARVTVPVKITNDTITFMQDASADGNGDLPCRASIKAASVSYVISDGGRELLLSSEQGTVKLRKEEE